MTRAELKMLYGVYRRYMRFTEQAWNTEDMAVWYFINQELIRMQEILFSPHGFGGKYWKLSKMADSAKLTTDKYIDARWVMRQAIKLHWNDTNEGWEHYKEIKEQFLKNQRHNRSMWLDDVPF